MRIILLLLALFSVTLAKPVDPCVSISDCSSCIDQESCGFIPSTGACLTGDENGPLSKELVEDWAFLDCPIEEFDEEEEEDEEESFSEEDEEEEEEIALDEEDEDSELETRRHGNKRLRNGKVLLTLGKNGGGKGRHRNRNGKTGVLLTSIVVGKNGGKGRHRHGNKLRNGKVVTPITSVIIGKNKNGGGRHRNGNKNARNLTLKVKGGGGGGGNGGRHRTTGSTGSTGSTGATSTGSTGTTSTGSTGATSTSPAFQTQPVFFTVVVMAALSLFVSIF